jgi:Peptidase M15
MTPTIKLSEHFSWEEVTFSSTASRLGINNSLPEQLIPAVQNTTRKLERVRALLNSSMHIDSWYRSLALNTALKSKSTSQHIKGEAVDFVSPEFGTPLDICKKILHYPELVVFDQLILEHTWVHISFCADPATQPRKQVLSLLESGGYSVGLTSADGRLLA